MTPDELQHLGAQLEAGGTTGVQIGFVDNNGIVRSRIVPVAEFAATARRGVGVTSLFAVFDSHDVITYAHDGLSTPSGDVRLVPVVDGDGSVRPLAGQPGLAWVAGRQVSADGDPWPYCQRTVLERQVEAAAEAGYAVKAGFEMELAVARAGEGFTPAHRGPAYGPNALRDVDEFVRQLLGDLRDNGIRVGQLHAEYGPAQLELTLEATDPLTLADTQVLARQTVHAAARAHDLQVSFAPLPSLNGAGNGWHLHSSLTDLATGENALTGDGPHGLSGTGAAYLAGLLRELPGIVAVTAPSTGSLVRRRPGYFAGAFEVWGVENREATLRLVPPTRLLGPAQTNVELKASDASANPYLALAVVIGAGLAGVRDGAALPDPVQEDVGTWDEQRRSAAGIRPLATTHEEQQANLLRSNVVRDVLGDQLLGAFAACRESDAAWAADHTVEETLESLRWQY